MYFDSDELFDPTSDDSGEEYVPQSGHYSDTDTGDIVSNEQEIQNLRFPHLMKLLEDDNEDGCCGKRGRSATKVQMTYGKKKK